MIFDSLPDEINLHILSFLGKGHLVLLGRTCSYFRTLINEYNLCNIEGTVDVMVSFIKTNDVIWISKVKSIIAKNTSEFIKKCAKYGKVQMMKNVYESKMKLKLAISKECDNLDIKAYVSAFRHNQEKFLSYLKKKLPISEKKYNKAICLSDRLDLVPNDNFFSYERTLANAIKGDSINIFKRISEIHKLVDLDEWVLKDIVKYNAGKILEYCIDNPEVGLYRHDWIAKKIVTSKLYYLLPKLVTGDIMEKLYSYYYPNGFRIPCLKAVQNYNFYLWEQLARLGFSTWKSIKYAYKKNYSNLLDLIAVAIKLLQFIDVGFFVKKSYIPALEMCKEAGLCYDFFYDDYQNCYDNLLLNKWISNNGYPIIVPKKYFMMLKPALMCMGKNGLSYTFRNISEFMDHYYSLDIVHKKVLLDDESMNELNDQTLVKYLDIIRITDPINDRIEQLVAKGRFTVIRKLIENGWEPYPSIKLLMKMLSNVSADCNCDFQKI